MAIIPYKWQISSLEITIFLRITLPSQTRAYRSPTWKLWAFFLFFFLSYNLFSSISIFSGNYFLSETKRNRSFRHIFFQIQIFGYMILGYLYLYLLEVRHCVDFLLEFQWSTFVIVNSSPYALLFGISKFAFCFYLFLRI